MPPQKNSRNLIFWIKCWFNIDDIIAEATFGTNEGTEDENGTSDDAGAGNSQNVPHSLLSGDVLHALDILRHATNGDVRELTAAKFCSFEACLIDDMQKNKTQCKITEFFHHAQRRCTH